TVLMVRVSPDQQASPSYGLVVPHSSIRPSAVNSDAISTYIPPLRQLSRFRTAASTSAAVASSAGSPVIGSGMGGIIISPSSPSSPSGDAMGSPMSISSIGVGV